MKRNNKLTVLGLALLLSSQAFVASAQSQPDPQKTRQRTTTSDQEKDKKNQKPVTTPAGDRLEPDDPNRTPTDVPQDMQANRQEQLSEEVAVVPYYNNFFSTYRLGPEDVISVQVFGQERYSRGPIIIPPSGRIALALIPGGIFVNGKTVEQVSAEITKRYDEYIIEPQVTVSLDKAASYRYSILGDVAQPGIRVMSHRMTVTEAIAEAGGVLPTGNRSGVVVLRRQADGNFQQIAVNVSAIYKGKVPDNTYLVPGDQIMVPGNKFKTIQKIMSLTPLMTFARVFGLPF